MALGKATNCWIGTFATFVDNERQPEETFTYLFISDSTILSFYHTFAML